MNNPQAAKAIAKHYLQTILDSKGYVGTPEENLITQFPNWKEIKAELDNGQGSELKPDKNGVIKFNAVHSSSALGVNNFAPFKEHHTRFTFVGFSGFAQASFEKKLPTGISTPNLDFYLETRKEMIGIESKFIETLNAKLPNLEGNLDKYIARFAQLKFKSTSFKKLIEYYIGVKSKMNLDVAQLLKHTLGLLNPDNNPKSLKPVLVYIYWQPTNWKSFKEYTDHETELKDFAKRIKPFITFKALPYSKFWSDQAKNPLFAAHITKMKKRYEHDL